MAEMFEKIIRDIINQENEISISFKIISAKGIFPVFLIFILAMACVVIT
jgi:hypothetical protein